VLNSRFPNVENLLHFNLADFLVNFIKQFVSCLFWRRYQILFWKFPSYYC